MSLFLSLLLSILLYLFPWESQMNRVPSPKLSTRVGSLQLLLEIEAQNIMGTMYLMSSS